MDQRDNMPYDMQKEWMVLIGQAVSKKSPNIHKIGGRILVKKKKKLFTRTKSKNSF